MSQVKFVRDNSNNVAIFPTVICAIHSEVSKILPDDVKSAGFCNFNDRKSIQTYGESVSLKKVALEVEDREVIDNYLTNDQLHLIILGEDQGFELNSWILTNMSEPSEAWVQYCAFCELDPSFKKVYPLNKDNMMMARDIIFCYDHSAFHKAIKTFVDNN